MGVNRRDPQVLESKIIEDIVRCSGSQNPRQQISNLQPLAPPSHRFADASSYLRFSFISQLSVTTYSAVTAPSGCLHTGTRIGALT
jgi:hypothetical protein